MDSAATVELPARPALDATQRAANDNDSGVSHKAPLDQTPGLTIGLLAPVRPAGSLIGLV